MSNTAGAKAWWFLKRNPHCIGARRKAAAWGLMAREDPVAYRRTGVALLGRWRRR